MADAVAVVGHETAHLGKESLITGVEIAAGLVLSYVLSPLLNKLVAPLSDFVAGFAPGIAYAVGPGVNFAVAVLIAAFIPDKEVRMVALGMAIASVLLILAPVLQIAGAALTGFTKSVTGG